MFSCDLVNWVIKKIYIITMGLARLVELRWLVTFCRECLFWADIQVSVFQMNLTDLVSQMMGWEMNMRVIRGLFHKTIISVSKIWYLTHDSHAIICCCGSEINLSISQCQHSRAIIPHICRGPFKDVTQILITLWWINFLDCRTRVVLKKSGEVLDLVPPPSKVHNLIFGRTWIDSPGDMVLTNLTTGDKVVLYFQPCGWFG
jgi:hypothetical protein